MQKDSPKDQEKQKTQEVGGFWSYVPSMFTASSSPASASESSSSSSSSSVSASESSSSSSSSSVSIFSELNSAQVAAAGGSAVVGGVFAVAGAPVIGAGVVVGGAAAGIYYFGSAMASVGSKIASAVSTAVSTSQPKLTVPEEPKIIASALPPKLTMQEELQIRYQQIQAVNAARGEKIADRETIVANYKTNTQKNSSGNYEFTGNFSHIQNFFDEESKELIGQESGHHDD
jgi:hypothetical protein